MVNEEMLEFIRKERALGMGDAELRRVLITEGGWDQVDVDEAFLQYPSTPTVMGNVTPSTAPMATTPPDNKPTPVSAPVSPPATPIAIPVVEKTSSANIELDSILPSSSSPMLATTKIAHNQFLDLFSRDKAGVAVDPVSQNGAEAIKKEIPQEPAPKLAPPTPGLSNISLPLTQRVQPEKKNSSIESLLTRVDTVMTPSAPTTAPVAPAEPTPMKFDLSTLRGNTPAVAGAPTLATQAGGDLHSGFAVANKEAAQKNAIPEALLHGGGAKKLTDFSQPRGDTTPTPTVDPLQKPKEEEKKKAEIGTRTMVSDLLSHGTESRRPLPPSSPEKSGEVNVASTPNVARGDQVIPTVSPFQDDVTHEMKVKRTMVIILGALVALGLLAGGIFAFLKLRAPDPSALLSTAFSQFFSTPSFSYKGQVATNLVLSRVSGGSGSDGAIKFTLQYGGTLTSGANGYGDGLHKVSLSGGWKLPDSILSTSIESDIRVIGQTLYFHVLSLPEKGELDPALFKENWFQVDASDIARELKLSGVTSGTEEYGSFGGTSGEQALNTLLGKTSPLQVSGNPSDETVDGVATMRIPVSANPDRMVNFVQALYRKYTNHDLMLSEEQRVRFSGAMGKLSGDVWVKKEGGALAKISLAADFDDDIVASHVKGPISVLVSFTDFGTPVAIEAPKAILTFSELKEKLDEAEQLKELHTREGTKIANIKLLTDALENYWVEKGRYPKSLADLYSGGALTAPSIALTALKDYFYRSYQKSGVYTKSGQCLASGKVCAFYHLGVNLEDTANDALKTDADKKTAILGSDAAGCGGEAKFACYDVVAPAINMTVVGGGTPTGSAGTTSPSGTLAPVPVAPLAPPASTITTPIPPPPPPPQR